MSTHEHAEFGPSSISRIVQCPGSWKMCKQFPQAPDAIEAAEGDAAHWVMARYLRPGSIPLPVVGTVAPNGVPVTQEMLDGAEMYADAVGTPVHVEERLPASDLIHPDNWGTPDSWSSKDVTGATGAKVGAIIDIQDYKFGHRFVDVFENWQLVNYACLIIDSLGIDGEEEQSTRINFTIVQPRSYNVQGPVRMWSCLASDIRAMRNRIRSAIISAQFEDAECIVGPECRDCSARAHCTTLQRAALTELDQVGKPTPLDLEPDELGLELRMINRSMEILRARQTGLQEVVLSTVKGGMMVPGFRTEAGKGRERWKIPLDQLKAMGALMGVTVVREESVTPKQAIKAGISAEVVAAMTETPSGETKLVEDDGSLARRTFGSK